MHPLPRQGGLVLVTQNRDNLNPVATDLFKTGATCCILVGRPLEGETTPFWMFWPSLDSLSVTTFTPPGIYWALNNLFPGTPGQDSP